ncbi:hypothetical protein KR084_005259 [Drosophila pseudotakahashii]|nr:hypothetical protein KR084_005259 [Drosophila pseudotakahashii]
MSSEEIKEVIGQGPNLQNEDPKGEEAYGAGGDDNGGHPEGNGDPKGVLELDNNQGENSSEDKAGEKTPPLAPTPMPREDESVSTEPQGDNPSDARPPTPEESGEEEGDGLPPPKKFKC